MSVSISVMLFREQHMDFDVLVFYSPYVSALIPQGVHLHADIFDTLASTRPTHPQTLKMQLNSAMRRECIPTRAFRLSLLLVLAEQN